MYEMTPRSHSSLPEDRGADTEEPRLPAPPTEQCVHETVGAAELNDHRCLRSKLATAIVKASSQLGFGSVLIGLIKRGGNEGIQRLWSAAAEILQWAPDEGRETARRIAAEISNFCTQRKTIIGAEPPLEVVGRFLIANTSEPHRTIKFFKRSFDIDPLRVVLNPDVQRLVSKSFLWSYLHRNYEELISDSSKSSQFGELVRMLALRRDKLGLEVCKFICDRYEASRKWVGNHYKAEFLWKVRDDVTQALCESPLACERNLKLALLFPDSVPHPCLDFEAQRIVDSEQWILKCSELIKEGYGCDHSAKIFSEISEGTLSSASFVRPPALPSVPGVQVVRSRFDVNSNVLIPLYSYLGISPNGGVPSSVDVPPRSWVSEDDRVRFRRAQIVAAFKTLADTYRAQESPDRIRENGREFIRAVVRMHPYSVAEAGVAIRKLDDLFVGDLFRVVREEVIKHAKIFDCPEADRSRFRGIFTVAAALGMPLREYEPQALQELQASLLLCDESKLKEYTHGAFLTATRELCSTTPEIELVASSLVQRHLDTPGASLLAHFLSEVRCPDGTTRDLILSQARRADLRTRIWLNYAHAAIGFGIDEAARVAIRRVFEERYATSVRSFARWCSRARTSLRILVGELYPEVIGDIQPFRGATHTLSRSPLEGRVIKRIESGSGVRVIQDVYIPWAPSVDGVVLCDSAPHYPILLLIDGERYHAVNGRWSFRGFDGHSVLVTRILTRAGYGVARISAHLGESGLEGGLGDVFSSIARYLTSGEAATAERLVINPPDDFTEIAGKVVFYTAVEKQRTVISSLKETLNSSDCSAGTNVDEGYN